MNDLANDFLNEQEDTTVSFENNDTKETEIELDSISKVSFNNKDEQVITTYEIFKEYFIIKKFQVDTHKDLIIVIIDENNEKFWNLWRHKYKNKHILKHSNFKINKTVIKKDNSIRNNWDIKGIIHLNKINNKTLIKNYGDYQLEDIYLLLYTTLCIEIDENRKLTLPNQGSINENLEKKKRIEKTKRSRKYKINKKYNPKVQFLDDQTDNLGHKCGIFSTHMFKWNTVVVYSNKNKIKLISEANTMFWRSWSNGYNFKYLYYLMGYKVGKFKDKYYINLNIYFDDQVRKEFYSNYLNNFNEFIYESDPNHENNKQYPYLCEKDEDFKLDETIKWYNPGLISKDLMDLDLKLIEKLYSEHMEKCYKIIDKRLEDLEIERKTEIREEVPIYEIMLADTGLSQAKKEYYLEMKKREEEKIKINLKIKEITTL